MVEARYRPRKLELEALIKVLVGEHTVMRGVLQRAREAAGKQDFEAVGGALRELEPVFRQHIADEESQILGLLIEGLGVKGAAAEIGIFQQHRPIYQLMKKVAELAAMAPAELEANHARLNALFDEHTAAEEAHVFPRATSLRSLNSQG